ncbi:MAG: HD domain-containing phosphohydrolase, partial [Nitrospinota bacterium]
TEGHSRKVRNWVSIIGKRMGLDKREVRDIITAATLHDIGKVGIPDSILNKPDKLSDIEFEKIKEHPLLGLDSIQNGDYLWMKALNMKSFFRYNWLGIFILFLAVSALFINSPLYAHGNKKHSDTSQTEVMKAPTSMESDKTFQEEGHASHGEVKTEPDIKIEAKHREPDIGSYRIISMDKKGFWYAAFLTGAVAIIFLIVIIRI